MAFLKNLALTGAFAAVAVGGYSMLQQPAPEPDAAQIIKETDALLSQMGLVDTNFSRLVSDENGKQSQFCLDVKPAAGGAEMEACFKLSKGHVKLAAITRK
ncbi:MAG: hypothetical protein JNM12_03145 [Alphaproteobacteria bacterium]|nr:hypothetical protein [Alphaproteobacteria bacterium]